MPSCWCAVPYQVRPSETGLACNDKCVALLSDYDEAIAAVSQLPETPQGQPQHPGERLQHRCLPYGYSNSGSHWQLQDQPGALSLAITCAIYSNNGELLAHFKPRPAMLCAIYPRHRHLSHKVQLSVQFAQQPIDAALGCIIQPSTRVWLD